MLKRSATFQKSKTVKSKLNKFLRANDKKLFNKNLFKTKLTYL